MTAARQRGFLVTCDWCAAIDAAGGEANPRDVTDADRLVWVHEDIEGVRRAAFFWLLFPERAAARGAFFEFAIAWHLGKFTIASGPNLHESVFSALADVRVASDDEALAVLGDRHGG